MNKRKAYRATNFNQVHFEELARRAAGRRAMLGMDVGKKEILAVLRWAEGEFERPWKIKNPLELRWFAAQVRSLAGSCDLKAAMEPTGTYGDALRAQFHQQGIPLVRVGGKAAHDYAEIFDGVPSQHDGKDAAIVAELAAINKGQPWPYREPSEGEAKMAYWVDWLDAQERILRMWTGRHRGQLKITKRGSALVRRWLYFAAMRTVQHPLIQPWFEAKKAKDKDRGNGALTAVMRKRMLASYAVGVRLESGNDEWSCHRCAGQEQARWDPGSLRHCPGPSRQPATEEFYGLAARGSFLPAARSGAFGRPQHSCSWPAPLVLLLHCPAQAWKTHSGEGRGVELP